MLQHHADNAMLRCGRRHWGWTSAAGGCHVTTRRHRRPTSKTRSAPSPCACARCSYNLEVLPLGFWAVGVLQGVLSTVDTAGLSTRLGREDVKVCLLAWCMPWLRQTEVKKWRSTRKIVNLKCFVVDGAGGAGRRAVLLPQLLRHGHADCALAGAAVCSIPPCLSRSCGQQTAPAASS